MLRRNPLTTNASALMVSSLATGALGLVYWIVAEKILPTAEVGRASAIISSATVLSSLACLSLGGVFQRFLPVAGGRSRRLIFGGYALTSVTAVVLGTGFLLFGFGNRILHTTTERWAFPFIVLVFACYALTDPVLIGLRESPAVAVKNVSLSVIKILPLFFMSVGGTALAVSGSWALLAAVITAVFVFHVFRVASARAGQPGDALPAGRELLAFQGTFFVMMIVGSVTPLVLPLLVVAQKGTTANAYFNLAWTMCTAAGLLRSAVGSAFIVEASQPGADRAALLRQLARMLSIVTAATVLGLAICGPAMLWIVGSEYFHQAGALMVVMAVTAIVETLVTVFFLLAQLQRKLRLLMAAQVVMVTVTVAGSWLLLGPLGLTGVGVASLSAASASLLLVAVPMIRIVRDITAQPVDPAAISADADSGAVTAR